MWNERRVSIQESVREISASLSDGDVSDAAEVERAEPRRARLKSAVGSICANI